MKIRLYTQYGRDQNGHQFAYCMAVEAIDDDDGGSIIETPLIFVSSRDTLDNTCKAARHQALRLLEQFTLNLSRSHTIEFVPAMDEEG